MTFKGIYEEGTTYVPDDMVVYGGSVWCTEVATSEKPPAWPWTIVRNHTKGGNEE